MRTVPRLCTWKSLSLARYTNGRQTISVPSHVTISAGNCWFTACINDMVNHLQDACRVANMRQQRYLKDGRLCGVLAAVCRYLKICFADIKKQKTVSWVKRCSADVIEKIRKMRIIPVLTTTACRWLMLLSKSTQCCNGSSLNVCIPYKYR